VSGTRDVRIEADTSLSSRRRALDALYSRHNSRDNTANDPVRFLYRYGDPRDREVVGLVASSLALGNVAQILAGVESVLRPMGPRPCQFLERASRDQLQRTFAGFRHRFIDGGELASMLAGLQAVIANYGSLGACFANAYRPDDDTICRALSAFVTALRAADGGRPNRLLPSPDNGSACKRLNLFLRWMVRRDNVDPGGWDEIPPARLIIPLDTHVHRIGLALGMTTRRQANLRTALEITAAFREIAPDDPARYDFALAHLGIDGGPNLGLFLREWRGTEQGSHA